MMRRPDTAEVPVPPVMPLFFICLTPRERSAEGKFGAPFAGVLARPGRPQFPRELGSRRRRVTFSLQRGVITMRQGRRRVDLGTGVRQVAGSELCLDAQMAQAQAQGREER